MLPIFPYNNIMKSSKNVTEIQPHSVTLRENGRTRNEFTSVFHWNPWRSGFSEALVQHSRGWFKVPWASAS